MERKSVPIHGVAVIVLLGLLILPGIATADWCEDCWEGTGSTGRSDANCCTSDLSCDMCNWCSIGWTFVYGLLSQCIVQGDQASGYSCGVSASCDDDPWGGGGGWGGGHDENPWWDVGGDCNTGGWGVCPAYCASCY